MKKENKTELDYKTDGHPSQNNGVLNAVSKMEWEEKEIKLSAVCSIDFFVCVLWTFMKAASAPICMLIFFGI